MFKPVNTFMQLDVLKKLEIDDSGYIEHVSEVEKLVEHLKEAFNNILQKMNEEHQNDYRGNSIRLRVVQLVQCSQVVQSVPKSFPQMRAGIVLDKGFKYLAEKYGNELIKKGELMEKHIDTNLGIRAYVFGSVDLMLNVDGIWIPVEVKNSNNDTTISKGRYQAGIYAWLYDTPYALLLYGNDFRVDIIEPYNDDEIETMVFEVLKCFGEMAKKELCIKQGNPIKECKERYKCGDCHLPHPHIKKVAVRW